MCRSALAFWVLEAVVSLALSTMGGAGAGVVRVHDGGEGDGARAAVLSLAGFQGAGDSRPAPRDRGTAPAGIAPRATARGPRVIRRGEPAAPGRPRVPRRGERAAPGGAVEFVLRAPRTALGGPPGAGASPLDLPWAAP